MNDNKITFSIINKAKRDIDNYVTKNVVFRAINTHSKELRYSQAVVRDAELDHLFLTLGLDYSKADKVLKEKLLKLGEAATDLHVHIDIHEQKRNTRKMIEAIRQRELCYMAMIAEIVTPIKHEEFPSDHVLNELLKNY